MAKRTPRSAQQAELPRDRCPNCGGPLKFPEDWKEGLCPTCGIFVEILPSTPESSPGKESEVRDVGSRRQTAKFYLESEELLSDEKEKDASLRNEPTETTPVSKSDTAAPVPTPHAPVQPKALQPGAPQPLALEAPPSEVTPAHEEPPSREPPAPVEPAAILSPPPPPPPEPGSLPPPSPVSEPSREPPIEPPPPPPEAPTPEPEVRDIPEPELSEEAPVPIETEAVVEPEPEVTEEPEVLFEPSVQPEPALEQDQAGYEAEPEGTTVASAAVPVARADSTAAARRGPAQPRLRDRVLLYVGSMLVAFGGSGLVLGSFLHDMFRVPLFGHAYDAFGPVNMSAILFGGLFLLAGLAAIGLSLRGGVVKVRKAVRA